MIRSAAGGAPLFHLITQLPFPLIPHFHSHVFSTILSSHRADRVYGLSESLFAIPQAILLLPLLIIGLIPQV